jgi:prevent-host-death family protein
MNASEFKAKCLGVLDEVAATGRRVTILKRGKPVAEVGPVTAGGPPGPQASLLGTVRILGDVVAPPLPAGAWDVERRRRRKRN